MRHRWDKPNDKISAICLRCGCKRIAEKLMGRMDWVYIEPSETIETTKAPSCYFDKQ